MSTPLDPINEFSYNVKELEISFGKDITSRVVLESYKMWEEKHAKLVRMGIKPPFTLDTKAKARDILLEIVKE